MHIAYERSPSVAGGVTVIVTGNSGPPVREFVYRELGDGAMWRVNSSTGEFDTFRRAMAAAIQLAVNKSMRTSLAEEVANLWMREAESLPADRVYPHLELARDSIIDAWDGFPGAPSAVQEAVNDE